MCNYEMVLQMISNSVLYTKRANLIIRCSMSRDLSSLVRAFTEVLQCGVESVPFIYLFIYLIVRIVSKTLRYTG